MLLRRGDVAVFREGHIGEAYAIRGVGKTWLLMTLALVGSTGRKALGFNAPEPCRVLYVDGEMASEEVQERLARLSEMLRLPLTSRLVLVAADWQTDFLQRLDTEAGQRAIEPHVANADLVLLDNRSCLFDAEGEKDPTAWQPAQDWLLSLRRRGKAVLLAHHSNRQGGARGISKAEDPMNLLLKLSRPPDYSQEQGARFLVEFEKARGVHGPAAAPFVASLGAEGWKVEASGGVEENAAVRKIRDYLRAAAKAGELPKSVGALVTGARCGRTAGFEAFAKLRAAGEIVLGDDKCIRLVGEP